MAEDRRDIVYFGRTNYRNKDRLFGIKRRDRRQHMYVIGQTGTGKSNMIHNMIIQDIANGEGVCMVDPHGENVEGILEKIPEDRIGDVVYFNPADVDFNVGFNVLEIHDPKDKHLVASGLMGIFTKIWSGVWSARMEYIMNNAILALLDTPDTTLLGVLRLLVDEGYRQKIIANVKDPVVKAFWISEYNEWEDKFRNEAIAPIQNKVGQFLSTPLVRNIVGQTKSSINIGDIMNSRKILLVNVSKGRIGEDNSALLGAMIITKIQLAAMERVRIPEEERADFYLYVDEFQNFATDAFANILSEARKYFLNLILAHQYIGQLETENSTKVRDAVFGNVGTMVAFRVAASDAAFLEKEFEPEFGIQDMVNLPNYHIYLKLLTGGMRSRPFSARTIAPLGAVTAPDIVERVIESSRKKYAKPRWAVESEIMASSGAGEIDANTIECMNCGKRVKLPFTPTPGRPVYCPDCYAKVRAGEIAPAHSASREVETPRVASNKGIDELARLGIEFEMKDGAERPSSQRPRAHSSPAKHNNHSERGQQHAGSARPARKPSIIHGSGGATPVTRPESPAVHLSDLGAAPHKQEKPRLPGAQNIDDLKRSLKEALNKLKQ